MLEDIRLTDEYKAIKQLAPFENILLVTGENPAKAGTPYLAKAIDIAKKYFSNVKIEVMPLSTEDYKTLADHGMNGVICFQETYNHEHYKLYHPRGMKSKFEWRCDGFDRMGMAGVHSIGMGVLIGLEKEWRTDVVMMAHHLRYLQKHYWKTKYSVNFPRMRPAQNEGFQPNCFMTDKQLAQATFAMRIFDHDVDISYSTREPAYIRDNMATLGVTTMSAESKVNPGGYHTYPQALEQFTVSDERTAKVINARLKELGREPVWKDWDASFDFFGHIFIVKSLFTIFVRIVILMCSACVFLIDSNFENRVCFFDFVVQIVFVLQGYVISLQQCDDYDGQNRYTIIPFHTYAFCYLIQ